MAAWSFSALESFETCPKKHFHTRVVKGVPEPPGEAASFGLLVHKVLEERLKGGPEITGAFACYEPYAVKVMSLVRPGGTLSAEQKIALTRDLKPTSWFAKDVWFRAVLDFGVDNGRTFITGDWKTGKHKPSSQQLELGAAAVAAVIPSAEVFRNIFLWLKEKKTDMATMTRDQAEGVWEKFVPRVERIDLAIQNGDWPAKPNGLCRKYCPVKSCKHNGV